MGAISLRAGPALAHLGADQWACAHTCLGGEGAGWGGKGSNDHPVPGQAEGVWGLDVTQLGAALSFSSTRF